MFPAGEYKYTLDILLQENQTEVIKFSMKFTNRRVGTVLKETWKKYTNL